MTHLFHVGEPATTRADGPLAAGPGEGRVAVGPGGIQIVLVVDEPGEATREAVETGAVFLGVADEPGPVGRGRSALLVQVGERGAPGYLEASIEVEADVWWGADVELALCDGRGVVRAVRRFRGPMTGPSLGAAA
jgi:hypothetical protein